MTVYAEAAQRLRTLISFLEAEGIPIPRTELTGNLGEWLVMDRLIERGYEPTLYSAQHDYDIELDDGTRVEVKSGRYDAERSVWRFDNIRPDRFDILVAVKFEDGFEQEVFYLFDEDETPSLPPRRKTKPNDERRLIRLREDPTRHRRPDIQTLNERIAEHRGAWEKLPS
jgi:hypothetical protein